MSKYYGYPQLHILSQINPHQEYGYIKAYPEKISYSKPNTVILFNVLPLTFESWKQFYTDIDKDLINLGDNTPILTYSRIAHLRESHEISRLFKEQRELDVDIESCCNNQHGQCNIEHKIEVDYLKAKVFDELWPFVPEPGMAHRLTYAIMSSSIQNITDKEYNTAVNNIMRLTR